MMWIAALVVATLLVVALVVYAIRVRRHHYEEFKRERAERGFTRFERPMYIPRRQGFFTEPLPDDAPTGAIFHLEFKRERAKGTDVQKSDLDPDVREAFDAGEMSADQMDRLLKATGHDE